MGPDKKKILIIINNLGVGGAERLVIDDTHELLRRGFDVRLLTLKAENPAKSLEPGSRLPSAAMHRILFSGLFDFMAWRDTVAYIRKFRPSIVFTHLWFSNVIGVVASRITGVPTVISFEHNVYDSVKTWKQFAIDRILQTMSDKVVAVSPSVKESLMRHGIRPGNVDVVMNGIDIKRYFGRDKAAARKSLGIDAGEFVFVFIGRLIEQKAPDILIPAFAKVGRGTLLIAGDGILRPMLEGMAADLGVADKVRFLGVRNDVPDLLAAADCFILPSRHEGLPIVGLEAIAAGKPMILGSFASAADLMTPEVDGILAKSGDVDVLTSAMTRMMDDVSSREVFRTNMEKKAGKFSIERHVDAMLAYIK